MVVVPSAAVAMVGVAKAPRAMAATERGTMVTGAMVARARSVRGQMALPMSRATVGEAEAAPAVKMAVVGKQDRERAAVAVAARAVPRDSLREVPEGVEKVGAVMEMLMGTAVEVVVLAVAAMAIVGVAAAMAAVETATGATTAMAVEVTAMTVAVAMVATAAEVTAMMVAVAMVETAAVAMVETAAVAMVETVKALSPGTHLPRKSSRLSMESTVNQVQCRRPP